MGGRGEPPGPARLGVPRVRVPTCSSLGVDDPMLAGPDPLAPGRAPVGSGAAPVPASVRSEPPALIGICLRREVSGGTGTVTSRTPFLKRACAWSIYASSGSAITLRNEP